MMVQHDGQLVGEQARERRCEMCGLQVWEWFVVRSDRRYGQSAQAEVKASRDRAAG
jgi:hypothetical protein